jgi:hypothetical protein
VTDGVIEREGMQRMLDFLETEARQGECVVLIDDIKRLARDLIQRDATLTALGRLPEPRRPRPPRPMRSITFVVVLPLSPWTSAG